MNYLELIPKPAAASINTGLDPCPTSEIVKLFGRPRGVLTDDCLPATSKRWLAKIKTEDVGPFRATGHIEGLRIFRTAFAAVKVEKPALYAVLGSAGMFCCRRVRGSRDSLSNHGLGLAIDILIDGVLDKRGDDKCLRGTLELYGVLKRFGIYWGSEFGTEDSMHFELAAQTVRSLIAESRI